MKKEAVNGNEMTVILKVTRIKITIATIKSLINS